MNNKDQLLADVLSDGAKFALAAAAHNRRRRAVHHAMVLGGVVATMLAGVFVAHRPARSLPQEQIRATPRVEIMSDADLLAQLKSQPVMIVKAKDGISSVVFLDNRTDGRIALDRIRAIP